MGWVNKGDMSSPDRLNERPIYLRAIFLMLALVQSCIHIYFDSSAVPILVAPPPHPSSTEQSTHPTIRVSESLKKDVLPIVTRCLKVAAATCLVGPFVYTLSMRNLLWSCQLAFAKLYYNLPRSDARPSGYPPSRPWLMFTSFWVGFLLLFTWEASSFLFTTLLAQAPLKKGLPLSAGSKDPNGTLLNGVKSKTDTVKTFAFWELALIARLYPERRKAILADIERPGGACWTQMQVAALDVIRGISLRVSPPQQEVKPAQRVDPNALQIERLPMVAQPTVDKPIFLKKTQPQSRMERIETISENVTKTFTQSGQPWNPTQSPAAAKIKDVVERNSPRRLMQRYPQVQEQLDAIHASPIGNMFRTTRQQVINALVLGDGQGNAAVLVDAAESVTRMLVASLSEDVYGKAVAGVPEAVRVFAQAITDVEKYVDKNAQGLAGGIDEVNIVIQRLKAGVTELLSAFQMYLADVGLSIHELNLAKSAAAKRNLLERHDAGKSQIEGATSSIGQQSKMPNGQLPHGPKRDEGVDTNRDTRKDTRDATKQSQRRLVAPRERTKFDWGEGAGTERLFPQREMEKVR